MTIKDKKRLMEIHKEFMDKAKPAFAELERLAQEIIGQLTEEERRKLDEDSRNN